MVRRTVEVKREQAEPGIVGLALRNEGSTDAQVEVAPTPERQALVRDATHEVVAEAQVALVDDEEVREAVPSRGRADDAAERAIEQRRREAIAEHRGMAEQGPVGRRETVDASRDEVLERFGDRVERPELASGMGELEQEQRIPTRPGAELAEFALTDQGVVGQGGREVLRERLVERSELDCARLESQPGTEPLHLVPRGQARKPRPVLDALQRSGEQERRRFVHPHHVFDDQEQRLGEGRVQHRRCRLAQHAGAIVGTEIVHRLGLRHLCVDRRREQRCERHPFRRALLQPEREERARLGRGCVERHPECRPKHESGYKIRAVGGEGLARQPHYARRTCGVDHLLHQPRLSDTGFTDDLDARSVPFDRSR